MLNEKNQDKLENIISNILIKKDKKNKEEIKNFFQKSKIDFSKPENFIKVNIIIKKILNNLIENIIPNLSEKNENKNEIVFVYTNYRYLAANIESVCEKKEDDVCLTDKSRHIISIYLKYLLSGKVPKFEPTSNTYWIPSFGTYKKWIEFCEGLYELYYGNNQKYINIYNELLSEKKRLYKHLKHQWYIQFKDGKTVEGFVSFDNDIKNPYENSQFDKGTYYLLTGEFDERNYEKEYENSIEKFKIPKEDIKKIFKITYEILV